MRILVVEDEQKVANALREGLEGEHYDVVVERSGESAFFTLNTETFDLVLLDLTLPGLSGMAALKTWRTRFPAVPVIVLSASSDQQTVLAALGAGAAGFIPKSSSNEVMLHAVRLVQDGGKYLPPEVLSPTGRANSPTSTRRDALSPERLGLTARQLEVLRLIARGANNKVICRELGLAERTVKAHITAILRALNVTSRTQAAIAASKLGVGEVMPLR